MNVYKEIAEIDDMKDRNKNNIDKALDMLKKYPKECTKLLKELVEIEKELEEIDKEIQDIRRQIG